MKELPILFSTEMVRAVLDGRKTETRRVINPQPEISDDKLKWRNSFWYDEETLKELLAENKSPYGKAGDRLYVRETWRPKRHHFPIGFPYEYKATAEADGVPVDEPWKPSIHMPKEASRIWLRVKEVKVERVQDISEADAIAEGIAVDECNHVIRDGMVVPKDDINWGGAIPEFANLWDSINEKRGFGWDKNPFVWVVRFEIVSTDGRPQ